MKGMLTKPDIWKGQRRVLKELGEAEDRRVAGLAKINANPDDWMVYYTECDGWLAKSKKEICIIKLKSLYQVGEVVYVKEAYFLYRSVEGAKGERRLIEYLSDGVAVWRYIPQDKPTPSLGYHSPLFMPEWAARYFIKIVGVKAERVQDITPESAVLEGAINSTLAIQQPKWMAIDFFRQLWDSINAKGHWVYTSEGRIWSPPHPWESNPWVWVYRFKGND